MPYRVTLRTAAVIGRFFKVDLLAGIHPAQPAGAELSAQLEDLQQSGFIRQATARTYFFRHGLTHQMICESLPEPDAK